MTEFVLEIHTPKVGKLKKYQIYLNYPGSVSLLDFLVGENKKIWNFKYYVDIYLIFVYLYYIIFIIAWYIYHGKISRILDRTFHFNRTTNVSHNFRLSNKRNRWSSILSNRPCDNKGQNKQVLFQNLHPFFYFSHNFQVKIIITGAATLFVGM